MRPSTLPWLPFLLLPSFASTQVLPPSQRPVPADVKERILLQRGHVGKTIVQQLELFGLRGTLTREQWQEFRRRGVQETLIVHELDENGITPEMSSALQQLGVDFESWQALDQAGPGHFAAIADLVLIGRIYKIEYHIEGPYHTWVRVTPENVLKGESPGSQVLVKLLRSGPVRDVDGSPAFYEAENEPKFNLGERVLLFLRAWPRDLLHAHKVERALADPVHFTRQYGPPEAAEKELAQGGYYELVWAGSGAFKVVGKRAVSMSRALRVPNPSGERFDLTAASEQIQKVAEAQRQIRQAGLKP